jgi:lysophospholipase L1-like esterase
MRTLATCLLLTIVVLATGATAALAGERYVALGDSYSSGTGTRTYTDMACKRSTLAYPSIVDVQRPNTDLVFAACSGARTGDVLANQVASLTPDTRWVTITIGGNDAAFSNVIVECAKPSPRSCAPTVADAQAFIRNTLPGRLDQVYGAIASRAPAATVMVLSYPRLFMGVDCSLGTFLNPDEMRRLNETADLLREVTRARVTAAGPNFRFLDAIPSFVGHAVCSATEWLNGLAIPFAESFHPNRLGHAAVYAPLVRGVMG